MTRLTRRLWSLAVLILMFPASQAVAGPLLFENQRRVFSFGATTGIFDEAETYHLGEDDWVVFLDPFQAKYIDPGSGSEDILNRLLERTYGSTDGIPNWYLGPHLGPTSDNSLVVRTYDAVHVPFAPPARDCGGSDCVGAMFHVDYIPHGLDPTTNLHWIQVVTTNHFHPGAHGDTKFGIDYKIDVSRDNKGTSPYYDDSSLAATPSYFFDVPLREGFREHEWLAQLYLVTGPAPGSGGGEINVLGGIEWGWKNKCEIDDISVDCKDAVPEPAVSTIVGVGILAALWRRKRRQRRLSQ